MTLCTEFLRLIATVSVAAAGAAAAATDAQAQFGSFVCVQGCINHLSTYSIPLKIVFHEPTTTIPNHWIVFLPQNNIFAVREHIHIRIIIILLILFLVCVTNFVEIYRNFSISIFYRMKFSPLVLIKMDAEKINKFGALIIVYLMPCKPQQKQPQIFVMK